MKVLLSDTWAGGGASTFVATLARGLMGQGHTVDVIVGYRDSAAVTDYAREVRQVFRPPSDFNRVVLDGDYDVLQVTEDDLRPPFDYARRVQRLGLRARIVVTAHTEESVVPEGADVVVYVSEAARAKAPGPIAHSLVIPNGIDPAQTRTELRDGALVSDGEGPIAVWVGRVEDPFGHKDFAGLSFTIQPLLDRGWRVLVVDGSPPAERYPAADRLRRWFGGQVNYANQVPRAQVLGALEQAGQSGGVLLSTSRTEASPFIGLEALAVGCPIVVPRISGFAGLIEAGYATGYEGIAELFDVLDSRAFANARTGLPDERRAEQMVRSYLRVYGGDDRRDDAGVVARVNRTGARVLSHPRARAARQGRSKGR